MSASFPYLKGLIVFTVASFIVGCGGSPNGTRQLQSITVSPQSADAMNSGGLVHFVATGNYNADPRTVTPLQGIWSFCSTNPFPPTCIPQPGQPIFVQADGSASCNTSTLPPASGSFSVTVWAPVDPTIPISQLGPNNLASMLNAQATIICP